ncbi:MAG TPA: DUF2381 family protein [Myxococcaceae bacterium]|nr:DUF2381 family protein [Myxococcaceae bacterium]
MVLPTKWLLLALLLVASTAAAQPQLAARQRQDRRASLSTTPAEPMLELYVAAGNLTTAAFNAKLDPDTLVVDRTRFKWAEASEHFLMLEPFGDVSEKLIVQVGFKDRALPARAIIAVVSKVDVMDGKVEVDRRANSPEALLAALKQKEAELEEIKTRYAGNGPASLVLSEWLNKYMLPIKFTTEVAPADASGLGVLESIGYAGKFSALVAIRLRNLPGQASWGVGQARLTNSSGTPVKVLSVQMKPAELAQGEEGLVVVEVQAPPWIAGRPFSVTLTDTSGQRRLSLNLMTK